MAEHQNVFEDTIVTPKGKTLYICPNDGQVFSDKKDYFQHMKEGIHNTKTEGNAELIPPDKFKPEKFRGNPKDLPPELNARVRVNRWINSHHGFRNEAAVLLNNMSEALVRHPKRGVEFWQCPFDDPKIPHIFKTQEEFESHLIEAHRKALDDYLFSQMNKGLITKRVLTEQQKMEYADKIAEQNKIISKRKNVYYKCPKHSSIILPYDKFIEHMVKMHPESDLIQFSGEGEKLSEEDKTFNLNRIVLDNRYKFGDKTYYRCPIDGYRFLKPDELKEHLQEQHTPEQIKQGAYAFKYKSIPQII